MRWQMMDAVVPLSIAIIITHSFFCILFVHAPSKAGVLRAITETTEAGGKCTREFAPLLKMLNRKFLHRMKRKAQRHVTRRTDCMCAEIAIWLMTTNGGKTEKKNYRNEFRCKREKRIGRYVWCKIKATTARTAGTARAKAKKKFIKNKGHQRKWLLHYRL